MLDPVGADMLRGRPAAPQIQPNLSSALPEHLRGIRKRQRQRIMQRPRDMPHPILQLQPGKPGQSGLQERGSREGRPYGRDPVRENPHRPGIDQFLQRLSHSDTLPHATDNSGSRYKSGWHEPPEAADDSA
ncbi:hypothetical protein Aple_076960 [Acrocarpospora pleiomorpha]|uniref:Uncharacterized protein n=1 Tax=Acrocarpospora pleiomorpha TaxID=90975 RepID=A0A5M3XU91_9ACTN|nr:hypothetical protein Aple_076960 [Acrocarpospora pleiomorpha]